MHARLLGFLIVSLSLGLALAPAHGGEKEKPAKEPPPKKPGGEVVFQVEGELTAKDPLDRILKKSFCQVHKIKLEAGKTYCMELFSNAFDSFLRLEDESGKVLAEDDDGAGSSDSRIVLPIKEDSNAALVATTFNPSGRGPYRLVVRRMNREEVGRLPLEKRVRDLNNQGVEAFEKSDNAQAVSRLKEAVGLGQKLYPDGHLDLARSLNNLGFVLKALSGAAMALPYFEQALAMRQEHYPKEVYPQGHPVVAASLNELGSVLQAMGAANKALPYFEQALAMKQKLYLTEDYPQGHPGLASGLSNLALCLQALGAAEKALPYCEQALAMQQKLYPKEDFPKGHPELAMCLNNLGFVLESLGAAEKAQPYYEQALAMQQKLYPKEDFPKGHSDLAQSLNNLGSVLHRLGAAEKALANFDQALAMQQKLYPKEVYPKGHPDLAVSLNNLGTVLQALGAVEKALPYYEQALVMRRKLYPTEDYPKGHPDLALTLDHMASALQALGAAEKAFPYFEQALGMKQKLYPKEDYPRGHPVLAASLNNLGFGLEALGAAVKALPHHEQALAMCQKLYPKEDYPKGHPNLAMSLGHLGSVLQALGAAKKALPYHEQALAMQQKLYPKKEYPKGHLDLAKSLGNLGSVLDDLGTQEKALPYFEQALSMNQKLYPKEDYPTGHPHLAVSLNNLGSVLDALGRPDKALPSFQQALAMKEQLYPKEDYPKGHSDLAVSLINLGSVLHALGAAEKALPYYEQGLVMDQNLLKDGLGLLAENEAMDRFNSFPLTFDSYLSLTRSNPSKEAIAYGFTWNKKGALSLLLQRRSLPERLALAENTGSEKNLIEQWHKWLALRRRIDQFRDPTKGGMGRDKMLAGLAEEAERLERKLMAALPALKESQELAEKGPDDLLKALPRDVVLIDFLRYSHFELDPKAPGIKGLKRAPSYVAFVSAGGKLKRIELGPAEPIDIEATLWQRAVQSWKASLPKEERADLESQAGRAAQNLKRLLWDALAAHVPEGTKTLYLAPDGDLGRIPWAALPIGKDRILLEEYQIALVPHGPFLLQQLERKAKAPDKEAVLVLGGVDYGGKGYSFLKGTKEELDLVGALAKETGKGITPLSGPEAKVKKLREELPLARFAHLSTHGFFDEASYAEELKRQEQHQEALRKGYIHDKDKLTIGALGSRNTLAFVGLVLAGAGEPETAGEDRGILTGTGILELPLDMDLAVLTACETGLGARSGAEGVQGLQRAFHVAGCRNVIASLWKVDDKATVALMAKFYHELWRNNKAPLDALREAQLTLYRHPELIPALAGERGPPAFEKAVAVPAEAPLPAGTTRTPTRLWAGFVLSGLGR